MRGRVMVTGLTATRGELICSDKQWDNRRKGATGYIKSHGGGTYYVEHEDGTVFAAYRGEELVAIADPKAAYELTQRWLTGGTPAPQPA